VRQKNRTATELGCWDAMPKGTGRIDRASSNCATAPRLPGEGKVVLVHNLSAYQRPPSGTIPSPQQYVFVGVAAACN
jgi:hypothetical protein